MGRLLNHLWVRILITGAVLALALLVIGLAPEPKPKFLAVAKTLNPAETVSKVPQRPIQPIIIKKVVYTTEAHVSSPAPSPVAIQGSAGYIMPGDNCVVCVRQLTGRSQNGNAGSWVPSHSTPRVGDIMIFYPGEQGAGPLGHVAVVRGVNPDGSVNVAHCNWPGQTTFASTGKFY